MSAQIAATASTRPVDAIAIDADISAEPDDPDGITIPCPAWPPGEPAVAR
ncbi:hypothetical protein [uncultured Williamsia sp.]|nr:hypothetical protein [uncultured Williamsia sp.]